MAIHAHKAGDIICLARPGDGTVSNEARAE